MSNWKNRFMNDVRVKLKHSKREFDEFKKTDKVIYLHPSFPSITLRSKRWGKKNWSWIMNLIGMTTT